MAHSRARWLPTDLGSDRPTDSDSQNQTSRKRIGCAAPCHQAEPSCNPYMDTCEPESRRKVIRQRKRVSPEHSHTKPQIVASPEKRIYAEEAAEVPLSQGLVHHSADISETRNKSGEYAWEQRSNGNHKMKVSHDEIWGVQIGVARRLQPGKIR